MNHETRVLGGMHTYVVMSNVLFLFRQCVDLLLHFPVQPSFLICNLKVLCQEPIQIQESGIHKRVQ